MTSNQNDRTETHPLLPSGDWEGFYVYGPGQEQHRMDIVLHFQNKSIDSGGSDDIGAFSWTGQYDVDALICKMTKTYARHTVEYSGQIDENGIWGNWFILPYMKGGFHIWPKAQEEQEEETEKQVEVRKKSVQKVISIS